MLGLSAVFMAMTFIVFAVYGVFAQPRGSTSSPGPVS
jgi:hypothetical protein